MFREVLGRVGVCEACENKRREPTKTNQEQTAATTLPQCIFSQNKEILRKMLLNTCVAR